MEATSGFEPLNKGFADLSLTTWVRRLGSPLKGENKEPEYKVQRRKSISWYFVLPYLVLANGAGDGIRTRDNLLGKQVLYH